MMSYWILLMYCNYASCTQLKVKKIDMGASCEQLICAACGAVVEEFGTVLSKYIIVHLFHIQFIYIIYHA